MESLLLNKLNGIVSIYEDSNWFELDYVPSLKSSEEDGANASKLLNQKFKRDFELIYNSIQIAILTGEYASTDLSLLIEAVDGSLTKLNNLGFDVFVDHDNIYQEFKENFVAPSSTSISYYLYFLRDIRNKFEKTTKLNASFVRKNLLPNFKKNNKSSFSRLQLIGINIEVSKRDLNLSVDSSILEDLLIAHQHISELKNNNYEDAFIDILSHKCDFLIKKILYKFRQDKKNYLYAINYHDKELNFEDLDVGSFKNLDNRLIAHYKVDGNHQKHSELETKIYNTPLNQRSLEDYHFLISVYKRKESDGQLKKLAIEFEKRFKVSDHNSKLLNASIQSFKMYFDHELFRFELKNNIFKFDDLAINENRLEDLSSVYDHVLYKSYFPYLSFCKWLNSIIESYFHRINSSELDELIVNQLYKELDLLIKSFDKHLKQCFENFDSCTEFRIKSILFPYENCLVSHSMEDGNELKLYLHSSYILPINYEKIEQEIKELQRIKEQHLTLFNVMNNLKVEKFRLIKIKESVEKSDRRSIEILGVFSAIVLFSSGSLQIFKMEGMNITKALQFMLVFSYSLILFIFLIWLITRENIKSLTSVHRWFFFGLLSTTITILIYLFIYQ